MGFFIIVGLGLGLIALIMIVSMHYEKKRTESLKAVADSLSLSFSKIGSGSLLTSLNQFSLFSSGRSKKLSNVMHGRFNDIDITIMDYRYTTGGGKHSHTWKQTVIQFQSGTLQLPGFALRPENLFHKIGGAFGYQDIDFDSRPAFSKQYLLRGVYEQAIRNTFTDEVLDFYERGKGLSTEGDDDRLIFYRADKRVAPQEISSFLNEGCRLLNLIKTEA